MTSKITTLKNFLKTYIVYPITKTKAVYDDDGNRLDNILTELFQSVSSGKASVASAITDKGVTTASDAAFAVMAANIANIKSEPTGVDMKYICTTTANLWSIQITNAIVGDMYVLCAVGAHTESSFDCSTAGCTVLGQYKASSTISSGGRYTHIYWVIGKATSTTMTITCQSHVYTIGAIFNLSKGLI